MRTGVFAALALAVAVTVAPGWALERNEAIQIVGVGDDLRDDAALAAERNVPILLMFSAEHCGYCVRVEEEFLKPMLISGQYENRVLIRRLEMDYRSAMLNGFDGEPVSVDRLASRYGVTVTPTLVFVNADGSPLAQKLVGLMTPDFYGGYIDERIAEANDLLGGRPTETACDQPTAATAVC